MVFEKFVVRSFQIKTLYNWTLSTFVKIDFCENSLQRFRYILSSKIHACEFFRSGYTQKNKKKRFWRKKSTRDILRFENFIESFSKCIFDLRSQFLIQLRADLRFLLGYSLLDRFYYSYFSLAVVYSHFVSDEISNRIFVSSVSTILPTF